MTSYHSTSSTSQVSKKIYRYCEKELDNMTGFYYFGARYYAPWLGRWISCDPLGAQSGLNLYEYAQNNPINIIDIEGMVGETIFTKPVRDWARRGGAKAAKRLSKIKTKLKHLSQSDYAKRAKELGLPVPKGGKLSKKNFLKRLLEEAEAIKRVTDKEKFHQAVREIVEVVDKQIVALGGKGMADGGSAAGIAVSLLMAYKTRKAKNMLLGGGTALLISLSTETSKAEGEIENIRLDNIGVHLERQIEVMNSPVRWDLVLDLFDVSGTYTMWFTITHEGVIYNWNVNSPWRLEEDLRPRIYLGPGSLFNYTPKSSSPTNFIDLSSLEPAQEKEAYDIKGLSCNLGRICLPM